MPRVSLPLPGQIAGANLVDLASLYGIAYCEIAQGTYNQRHLVDHRGRADWLIQSCLLETGLSQCDFTDAEWRNLKDLQPIGCKDRSRGRPPEQNRSIINGIL